MIRATSEPTPHFARITLQVHSDLEGVGLTAAVATGLAAEGVACNVIAGFHHDHIFVPWERRDDAMAILQKISDEARA
ncbi:MAG: ACT domain-containing protein [Pseudomonadota bacterium]